MTIGNPSERALLAYAGPFGLFALLLALPGLARMLETTPPAVGPEFWVYPLQTVLCAAMLFYFRREYPRALSVLAAVWGIVTGVAVLVIWVSPQMFFHVGPRVAGGFDPSAILTCEPWSAANRRLVYEATVAMRFARLAVVVPLVEEIFWRGFLLRYLVRENFLSLPFGSWSPLSFTVVTAGFMLEHHPVDWPEALAAGLLYNLVAVRTRSLPACVLAHAITNALLGFYVMHTRQWGFW